MDLVHRDELLDERARLLAAALQVRRLNTAIDTYPSNLVANAFGFRERAFFDIDDPVSEPVHVDLGRDE